MTVLHRNKYYTENKHLNTHSSYKVTNGKNYYQPKFNIPYRLII